MAWTSPMTFVAGNVLTASQLNTHLRDNLLESAPAKATTAGAIFVGQRPNVLAERVVKTARVGTAESITEGSFTDLATIGPSVTCVTGTSAIVMLSFQVGNTLLNNSSNMGFEVSGDSSISADEKRSLQMDGIAASQNTRFGTNLLIQDLTPGTNIFTCKYKAEGSSTATFSDRFIGVLPL